MKKKVFLAIVSIMVVFLLTGCISWELKNEAKQYKKEGEAKLKAFLEEEFNEYTLNDVEQAITGNGGIGYRVSPFTTCTVTIDEKSYFFAYDRESDTYWSDYYYDEVVEGLKNKFAEYGILGNADSSSFVIGRYVSNLEAYLLLYEDDNCDKFFECIQSGEYNYEVKCEYYFSNESNFTPAEVNLDFIQQEIGNLYMALYNTDGNGTEKYNITDEIFYNAKDYDGEKMCISYCHYKIEKVNGLYFLYNDNYYDVEVAETEYKGKPENNDRYKDKKFEYTGEAYSIKATRLGDKDIENSDYTDNYVNEFGVNIEYIDNGVDRVFVFYENAEKYEGLYAYDALSQDMEQITSSSYLSVVLEETGTTDTVWAVFEEK